MGLEKRDDKYTFFIHHGLPTSSVNGYFFLAFVYLPSVPTLSVYHQFARNGWNEYPTNLYFLLLSVEVPSAGLNECRKKIAFSFVVC